MPMDIIEIEKKILEYSEKLEKKFFRIKNGKQKPAGMPGHLRKFYNGELARLLHEKALIADLETSVHSVSWERVRFEDGRIRVSINHHLSESYTFLGSRKSYELLKPLILRADLNPLLVTIHGNKIISISNLQEVNSLIEIMSVQDAVNNYFIDFDFEYIRQVLSGQRSISNKELSLFFKLKERSESLSFLCDLQSANYKLVPAAESVIQNQHLVSEDTFIFTVEGVECNYIIWESAHRNRATYIFKTFECTYIEDVHRLFDFISSNQNCKRRKLRSSLTSLERPFKSFAVLNHTSSEEWQLRIKGILQQASH
jgi:hypothetical protein